MAQIKFVQYPPIIDGTYKKDSPNSQIGFQKFEIEKTYLVNIKYEVVHKTEDEAEQLVESKHECKIDDYLNEMGDVLHSEIEIKDVDVETEDEGKLKKIEECIPSDDTDSDNDFTHFKNYEDPTWSEDDYEWLKKEDGTDIKNDNHS